MSRRRSAAAPADLRRGAPVFAALGHETRLRIVSQLCVGGPRSITQLTAGSGVTRQALTKHLRILEDAGLVQAEQQGRESLFEARPDRLQEARESLEQIAAQWSVALQRLADHIAREDT